MFSAERPNVALALLDDGNLDGQTTKDLKMGRKWGPRVGALAPLSVVLTRESRSFAVLVATRK